MNYIFMLSLDNHESSTNVGFFFFKFTVKNNRSKPSALTFVIIISREDIRQHVKWFE